MELKPCPFCGGEAFIRKLYRHYMVDAKYDRNCPMANMPIPYDTDWVTQLAAEAAWNKRRTMVDQEKIIKGLEPHIMTLEEVEDAIDTVVWVDRPTAKNESELFGLIQAYSRKFKIVQIKHIEMNMGEHMLYSYETYGKEWRCWDKRPTNEQREATPWPD